MFRGIIKWCESHLLLVLSKITFARWFFLNSIPVNPKRARESFNVGRVCRDVGEDVDQHEEEGHQQGHPTRNYFRWDQKACLQEQKT